MNPPVAVECSMAVSMVLINKHASRHTLHGARNVSLKASFGRMEPRVCREHGLLPLPAGERGGVRGFTIEGLGPPHPHPLPAGERESRRAANRGRAHHEGLDRNERNKLSGPILTFASLLGGSLANVRIKGPLANIGF